MTICELVLRANIPKDSRYPKQFITIGDHLRTKRLDDALGIHDLAKIMETTPQSIVHWESNHCNPNLKFYTSIIDFLGYEPPQIIEYRKTIEFLKSYRNKHRLSLSQLSKQIGITHTTLFNLERKTLKISEVVKNKIKNFYHQKGLSTTFFQ